MPDLRSMGAVHVRIKMNGVFDLPDDPGATFMITLTAERIGTNAAATVFDLLVTVKTDTAVLHNDGCESIIGDMRQHGNRRLF